MARGARVLVLLAVALATTTDTPEAVARDRRPPRVVPRAPAIARIPTVSPPPPPPTPAGPTVDRAVRCSCTSATTCPEIGRLSIAGFKTQPLYCNQRDGLENPGLRTDTSWYYQCAELSNRWLTESVGAPRIGGNADQLCDNADRSSFDVHTRRDAYEPVPGDLLVWTGYAMGHVGVVTSVSASAIVFANQNYGHSGWQYPILAAPRTDGFFGSPRSDYGLHAKCIIHPRRLRSSASSGRAVRPAGPCARVAPQNDGTYCGASRQSGFEGGDEGTLYTCTGGATTARKCQSRCTMEPAGHPDHCR